MPEVGIVMTLRDRVSNTMKAMADSGKILSKEFDSLLDRVERTEAQQTALAKGIAKTKAEIAKQSDTVKASKKAWDELRKSKSATSEEIDRAADAYQREAETLESMRDKLNEYTAASRDARAEMRGMSSEYRRMKQDMEGGSGGGAGGGSPGIPAEGGILGGLKQAGLTKMLGDAATQFLGTGIESMLGQPSASFVSSIASGAVSGAALGSIIPGIGTAVGALVGGLSGLVSGGAQIFEAKDDAFKDYYQDATQNAMAEQDSMITSGSGIAGSREQTQMAFAKRLGSDQAAEKFLAEAKEKAGKTNYSFDEITGYSKGLLNSYSPDEIFGVLQSLSDATAGLDLSSGDVSAMISGLGRMRTTGKATQEYLNLFSERGVDVYQALADSTGADKSEIAGMVSEGKIGGVDAATAILKYIDKTFGGLSEELAGTYDAMVDNLADAEANLQEYAGQGFNEERKKGIQAQQDWMTENEEALGEANKAIGAWKAELENSKEQYIRDAVDAMMGSDEYKAAAAAGDAAEMGKLMMQAKVQGMNEYNASEGAQLALEAELALADNIRDDAASNQAYWDAGYRKSQEYSKGLAAGLIAENNQAIEEWARAEYGIGQAPAWVQEQYGQEPQTQPGYGAVNEYAYYPASVPAQYRPKGAAVGLDRVPYDNFPALLHEGERVLTAREARSQDQGVGGVVVNMGDVTVREDADIDRIAQAFVEKLRLARMAG